MFLFGGKQEALTYLTECFYLHKKLGKKAPPSLFNKQRKLDSQSSCGNISTKLPLSEKHVLLELTSIRMTC